MRSKLAVSIFAIFILFFGMRVLAATPGSISLEIAPSNPAPFENVTFNLKSFAVNLDTVQIGWFVDGKAAISGIGKKSFSVTAKAAGIETKVEARIMLPDGEIDKSITILPGVMVLLWQATDSYVPPFYKGKALAGPASSIKVVALPEAKIRGAQVSAKNMTYSWKKDFSNDQDASGYGKNSYAFLNDYLDGLNSVEVTAQTTDGRYSAHSSISIRSTDPKIVFYKRDLKLGTLWENAVLDNYTLGGSEEIIVAAPYHISPSDIRKPELIFRWFINNTLANTGINRNYIPLKVEGEATGTSRLRLEIENNDKIFETARKEINVRF